MEQQSIRTYVAALILSFNKSNTLPPFLAIAKQRQYPFFEKLQQLWHFQLSLSTCHNMVIL